jgi:hypothetical protein
MGLVEGCARRLLLPRDRADAYDLVAQTPDGRFGFVRGIVLEESKEMDGVEVAVEKGTELQLRYEGDSSSAFYWIESRGVGLTEGELNPGTKKSLAVPAGQLTIVFSDSSHGIERHQIEAIAGTPVKFVLP